MVKQEKRHIKSNRSWSNTKSFQIENLKSKKIKKMKIFNAALIGKDSKQFEYTNYLLK